MAKKHFDDYYNSICKQYFELNEVMKDLSKDVENGMRTPEAVEQLKATITPIQNNYRTLSYIKYLLDKPTKPKKVKKFNKQSRNLLLISKGRQAIDLITENNKALEDANI